MVLLPPGPFIVCKEFFGIIGQIMSIESIRLGFQLDEPIDSSLGLLELFLEVLLDAYATNHHFVRLREIAGRKRLTEHAAPGYFARTNQNDG